ncbi:MAG: hypothetical protein OJF50_006274 [Nitrospira sp.]|jgi:hypothetical protein|nr:hypothetical protein [Nitrospira sp.]
MEPKGWADALRVLSGSERKTLLTLAERVVRQAVKASRRQDLYPLAILSSVLRELAQPLDALRVTEDYCDKGYAPILTSRSAAYCDLQQYDEAVALIVQAWDVCRRDPGDKSHAWRVIKRIRSEAKRYPELLKQLPRWTD